MEEQASPLDNPQPSPEGRPSRALILRRPAALPVRSLARGLTARVAAYLPARWEDRRGPLARAALAGGLLALGSIVGRLSSGSSIALLPARSAARRDRAGTHRRLLRLEHEVSTTSVRHGDGSTTAWRQRRTRIVEEWHAEG